MVNRVLIKGGLKRKEFVKVDDGVIGESGLEWLAMINESTGASQIAEIYSPRSISFSVQEVYLHRQEAFASRLEREKSVLIDDGDGEIKRVEAKYRVEAVGRERVARRQRPVSNFIPVIF